MNAKTNSLNRFFIKYNEYHYYNHPIIGTYSIVLRREKHSKFGFSLKKCKNGVFKITHIKEASQNDNIKKIEVGDVLLSINHIKIRKSMNINTINRIIKKSGRLIRLTLMSSIINDYMNAYITAKSKTENQGNIILALFKKI